MDDALRATLAYAARENEGLAEAIKRHLNEEQIYDAALATRASGDPRAAAELLERCGGHHAEAAACWLEAAQPGRCLDHTSRVAPADALYASSARLAVRAAVMLGQVPAQLEPIIAEWSARPASDAYDAELFLQLGDLLARVDRNAEARALFEQVVSIDREAALGRLSRLDRAVDGLARAAAARLRRRYDAPEDDPPEPGTVLAGRYHLEDYLGQGGSATVYRAFDIVLGEIIALKLFSGPFDPERQARFKREINLTRKFSHDNIVRIFDLVIADKLQGITMELVEGVTLNGFVRDNQCSLEERRRMLIQAASALGYAHGRGVIHRDVKPDNMLVAPGALLKVTDFGIAKAYEDISITLSGAFAGTPYYVAPEQVKSFKNVDRRADIYSLGVVAYELFTGVPPFDGRNMLEVLVKHAQEAPKPPRAIVPSLPAPLEELLLHMLAKSPADRVQSCEEVIARLSVLTLPE